MTAGSHGAGRAIWMVLIVIAGAGLSPIYACATPFAALATLAALKTDGRRDAALVIGLVWLLNQAIGYGFLAYPLTWDSLAWGGMIGVAAGASLLVAFALAPRRKGPMAVSLPFVGAFAAYEFSLYVTSFVLPSEGGAFALSVVRQIFVTNVEVLVGLTVLHWLISPVTHAWDRTDRGSFDSALPVR